MMESWNGLFKRHHSNHHIYPSNQLEHLTAPLSTTPTQYFSKQSLRSTVH